MWQRVVGVAFAGLKGLIKMLLQLKNDCKKENQRSHYDVLPNRSSRDSVN